MVDLHRLTNNALCAKHFLIRIWSTVHRDRPQNLFIRHGRQRERHDLRADHAHSPPELFGAGLYRGILWYVTQPQALGQSRRNASNCVSDRKKEMKRNSCSLSPIHSSQQTPVHSRSSTAASAPRGSHGDETKGAFQDAEEDEDEDPDRAQSLLQRQVSGLDKGQLQRRAMGLIPTSSDSGPQNVQ